MAIGLVALATTVFTTGVSLFKTYFSNKQEIKASEHKTRLILEESKQKAIAEKLKHEHILNIKRLGSTSRGFKYITFFLWYTPFVITIISPEHGDKIFNNLTSAPQWYIESCVTVFFTIWSIAVSRDTVQAMFSNLGVFFKSRRFDNQNKKILDKLLKMGTDRPFTNEELKILHPIVKRITESGI